VKEVEARLKLSAVDRTGNVLSKIGKQMQDVNRRAAALNKQQSLVARSSNAAFAAIGRFAAPAAVAYGVQRSVVAFADMERQMGRIGITADATREETEGAFIALQARAKEMALPLEQAVKGLDTLVSSGLSLKEAMAFLPSVLATAQASGAATEDIANTAIKSASALKLQATEMQRAFDIMVAGGKAGQFELKDMALYVPDLANSFATLGYEGEEGLKKLVALLQTVREDTGTAEAAATNLGNVFGKIYSEDTAGKFKKFGIDLSAELAKARKNGEDTVAAFVRISNEAIKGDLSQLPKLFTDQQFRLGMQSLMTSAESYEKFLKTVNDTEINGTVFRDLQRITSDSQASIDKLSSSWDKLMRSVGQGASRVLVPAMDAISNDLDYGEALRKGLEKSGMDSWLARENWIASELPFGSLSKSDAADKMAVIGGYNDDALRKKFTQGPQTPYGWKPPKIASNGVPLPEARPTTASRMAEVYAQGGMLGRDKVAEAKKFLDDRAERNALMGTVDRWKTRREMREIRKSDDHRTAIQSGRDGDVTPRFSLLDAMRMNTNYKTQVPTSGQSTEQIAAAAEKLSRAAESLAIPVDGGRAFYRPGRGPENQLGAAPRTGLPPVPADKPASGGNLEQTLREMSSLTVDFESSGKAAGKAIEDSASKGGEDFARIIGSAAGRFVEAVNQAAAAISAARPAAAPAAAAGQPATPKVNANTGKTNTFITRPGTGGGA
jgi:TP901 family phage tail tape measure protein